MRAYKGVCILAVLALGVSVLAGPRSTAGRGKMSTPQPASGVSAMPAQGVRVLSKAEAEPGGLGSIPVIYNDGSSRGTTADAFLASAYVYKNDTDSGFGLFWNLEPQAGAFYPGTMTADEMILGNGFVAGGTVTGFEVKVFRSSADPSNSYQLAEYTVEMWDGDPYGAIDTPGSGTGSQTILQTCTWTGVPGPGTYWLHCDFAPVVVPNDRVWLVLSGDKTCRTGWRISFLTPTVGSIYMGTADVMEYQDDYHANGGICCNDHLTACDYAGGVFCPTDATGSRGFCSDGFAEEAYLSWFGGPCAGLPSDSCASFVANIFTQSNTWMGVLPIGSSDAGAVINFNEITLKNCNDKDVNMEMKVHGWDHDLSGLPKLKTWEVDIDDAGYAFSISDTLAYKLFPCVTNADCITEFTGRCTVMGNVCTSNAQCLGFESCAGPTCDYPTGVGGFCSPAYQMAGHPDGVLLKELPACDVSTPDIRCGSTLSPSGVAKADEGKVYYGASLRYVTGVNTAGTATVITLPASFMKDNDNAGIPLVGTVDAVVICPTGQCCDLDIPDDPPGPPYEGCVSDTLTEEQCAALVTNYNWDPNKTCADACIQCTSANGTRDLACADGDACTVDTCVDLFCVHTAITVGATECCDWVPASPTADINGGGTITDNNDGEVCTDDVCAKATQDCAVAPQCGVADNPARPDGEEHACDDGNMCTYNDIFTCIGGGQSACAGLNVNDVPCATADDCLLITGVAFDCVPDPIRQGSFCLCVLSPSLTFEKVDPPLNNCYEANDKVEVDVMVGASANNLIAAQITVLWDTSCMTLDSIQPGTVLPYEIMRVPGVEGPGSIFLAVGVDPFIGGGAFGGFAIAHMTFTKIGVCNTCVLCFGGVNPYDTFLSDDQGQYVGVVPECSKPILDQDTLTLDVPGSVAVNVDCNHNTAIVTWDAPTAGSDCDGVTLVCSGTYPNQSAIPLPKVMHGGEFPLGISNFCCTATSVRCGDTLHECWTVEVMDGTTLDIEVQLSPIMMGEVDRCIEFELYANCIEAPVNFGAVLHFGGMWDYIGHYTDSIKVPEIGQWYCVTARDQLHTLRATTFLECVDGVYKGVFKGDPFWGGNWLIGGNLDGYKKSNPNASHNVIDILDFGQFVAHYMDVMDPNTDCLTEYPLGHADINGDGAVNTLDFAFIMRNFLDSSKDACCPDAAAKVWTGRTEVSVLELRQMGLGELSVGDLNKDGLLNVDDMNMFMAGQVPAAKAPARLSR